MQQKSATTKIKGGIMKTLSNPLLKFDTYIDIKTAMSQQAYPIVLNGCVDSQKAHFIHKNHYIRLESCLLRTLCI